VEHDDEQFRPSFALNEKTSGAIPAKRDPGTTLGNAVALRRSTLSALKKRLDIRSAIIQDSRLYQVIRTFQRTFGKPEFTVR